MFFKLLLVTSLLVSCASVERSTNKIFYTEALQSFNKGQEFVIWNNEGGSTYYASKVRALIDKGLRVRIANKCVSSCTNLLGSTGDLCYSAKAKFVFHAPTDKDAVPFLLKKLPPKLRAWLVANNAMNSAHVLTTLSGKQIATLDYRDRTCKKG